MINSCDKLLTHPPLGYKGKGEILGRSVEQESNVAEDVTNAKNSVEKKYKWGVYFNWLSYKIKEF